MLSQWQNVFYSIKRNNLVTNNEILKSITDSLSSKADLSRLLHSLSIL